MGVFWGLLVLLVAVLGMPSCLGDAPNCTLVDEAKKAFICQGGTWPMYTDAPLAVDATAKSLTLENIELKDLSTIRPLPVLKNLQRLFLRDLRSFDVDGTTKVSLPWDKLKSLNINRARLLELEFDRTMVGAIGDKHQHFLQGMPTLETLKFLDSSVTTFGALALEDLNYEAPANPIKLKHLRIVNDKQLKKFPWESLNVAANTLETLELSGNLELTEVSLPADASANAPRNLTKLTNLEVTGNRKLITFPNVAITAVQATDATTLQFENNGNECETCTHQQDFITWVLNGEHRTLIISCKVAESDELRKAGGTAANYFHANPNCNLTATPPPATTVQPNDNEQNSTTAVAITASATIVPPNGNEQNSTTMVATKPSATTVQPNDNGQNSTTAVATTPSVTTVPPNGNEQNSTTAVATTPPATTVKPNDNGQNSTTAVASTLPVTTVPPNDNGQNSTTAVGRYQTIGDHCSAKR
ncbi:hypothetical protein BV898_13581 [Hypsibius exemplaris]|uniref:Uncharacterized protein n=1 Tax=Hypsibius exemplaris TaxID=2072580 RepID=A0A1W0WAD0_HYPEX|nr:hypothetical protein BV898_13581 [Hypsibius exemplaris]